MAKRAVKKQPRKDATEHARKERKDPGHPQVEPFSDDSAFNYGGLPSRDLKKNLGCG